MAQQGRRANPPAGAGPQPSSALALPLALVKAIAGSRSSGVLNLSGRSLTEIPAAALNPDEPLPETGDGKWWEVTELTKADLSRNKLTSIEGIQGLTTLTHLDLSSNEVVQLPHGLSQLSLLRLIDASRNPNLTALPDLVANFPALASLSVAECRLRTLPVALGGRQQPALASVSAPNNQISALPPGFVDAGQLVKLDLSKNCIQILTPSLLGGLRSLVDCELSCNAIEVLPDEIGCLKKLQILRLRENKLRGLPEGIAGCTSLVELHCGFNTLKSLPPQLGACTRLQTLDVRNNQLTELPAGMCALRLVLLDVTNNDLRSLPAQLGRMTTLRALVLDGNPLKLISRQIISGPMSGLLAHLESRMTDEESGQGADALAAGRAAPSSGNIFGVDAQNLAADMAKKLTVGGGGKQELTLRSTGLSAVPPEVWKAGRDLRALDLSGNPKIGFVPPEGLASLPGLTSLHLGDMGLQHWPLPSAPPPHPATLPQLVELSMRGNPLQLHNLAPFAFAACPTLTRLDLAGVRGAGSMVVGIIAPLQCLEVLDLSRTGCNQVPGDVWHLPCLRVLQLDDNSINDVPEWVAGLTRLEELHLRNNALATLLPALGTLAPPPKGRGALRILAVEGNMLRTVRRPILEAGTPALLDYLRDRMPT